MLVIQASLSVLMLKTAQAAPLPPPVPVIEIRSNETKLTPEDLIYKYMGQPSIMVRIAFAESSLDPKAKGPTQDQGLFQIIPSTWKAFKCIGDPYNIVDNIICAEKIRKDGLHHWNASRYGNNGWGKYL